MSVYKEEKTNTWRVIYRYTDWTGQRKQSQKRGFKTKREAQAWEREQMNKATADLDMTFESFIKLYTQDMQSRIKENTWHTKENIINTKLLPYFKKRKISQITPKDIINWQNEMINYRDAKGKPYSPVYLKTLHNQLSAIFNHAVKYYGLRENPAAKVGNMGKSKSREMLFWTKESGYEAQRIYPVSQCEHRQAGKRVWNRLPECPYPLRKDRFSQAHPTLAVTMVTVVTIF